MTRKRTPSPSTCLVLAHLQATPDYGYTLMKSTGLKSGTLYPILMRLKDRGFLAATWEEPQGLGRPPRQNYHLTPKGRAYAIEVLGPNNIQSTFHGVTI